MALTYAQRDAVTKKFFINKITQQAYDSVVFLKRIAQGKRVKVVSGGKKVYHPIRYQQLGTSQFIDPDTARIIQNVDTRTALELNWTYLVTDWVITMREKVENRGDAAIIKLMDDKLAEVKEDTYEKFSNVLFQATASKGTLELDGLMQIIQTTASDTSYAGISSADAPAWTAGYYDSSTSALSLFGSNSLSAAITACTFGDAPNLIVATRDGVNLYASLLQPQERRVPGDGKSGATDLAFMGIPIIADPHVLSNHIFILNTDHLWLYVQKGYNFQPGGWEKDPTRYDADVNVIKWVGNLVADKRRVHGAFTNISTT